MNLFICVGRVNLFICPGRVNLYLCRSCESVYLCRSRESVYLCRSRESVYLCRSRESVYLCRSCESVYLCRSCESVYLCRLCESVYLRRSCESVYLCRSCESVYLCRSCELLIVNHHGSLRSYYVSRDSGFKLQHSFVFNQEYPLGVSSVVYHPTHRLLLVGGCGQAGDREGSVPPATQEGITAWRILSGYPHYKLVTEYEEGLHQVGYVHGGNILFNEI